MSTTAKQRLHWKLEGLCSLCGGKREDLTKKLCLPCRNTARARAKGKSEFFKQRRIEWESQNLCKKCGSPLELITQLICNRCKETKNMNRKTRNSLLKEQGLCVECKAPLVDLGRQKCEDCRDEFNERCLRRINERRAADVCIACPNKKPVGARDSCIDCWYKELSKTYMHKNKYGIQFKELFEKQAGRCAYTNELLIIGDTVHLDHKIPISRGGKNEFENFQFIHKSLNILKGNMTHDEFLSYLPYLKGLIDRAITIWVAK